jgi:hypothetical protein
LKALLSSHHEIVVKISRLYQPRNPLFWIMLVLNLLSALLGWITHNHALTVVGSLLVTGFAVGNAVLGTWLAWRLLNS